MICAIQMLGIVVESHWAVLPSWEILGLHVVPFHMHMPIH